MGVYVKIKLIITDAKENIRDLKVDESGREEKR